MISIFSEATDQQGAYYKVASLTSDAIPAGVMCCGGRKPMSNELAQTSCDPMPALTQIPDAIVNVALNKSFENDANIEIAAGKISELATRFAGSAAIIIDNPRLLGMVQEAYRHTKIPGEGAFIGGGGGEFGGVGQGRFNHFAVELCYNSGMGGCISQ